MLNTVPNAEAHSPYNLVPLSFCFSFNHFMARFLIKQLGRGVPYVRDWMSETHPSEGRNLVPRMHSQTSRNVSEGWKIHRNDAVITIVNPGSAPTCPSDCVYAARGFWRKLVLCVQLGEARFNRSIRFFSFLPLLSFFFSSARRAFRRPQKDLQRTERIPLLNLGLAQ